MSDTVSQNGPLTPQPPQDAADAVRKDTAENKDIAALSYLWILSIFIYLFKRHSPFVRFHAKQGMVLFGFSILFALVPFALGRLLQLCVLIACIVGFISAAQGNKKKLPIVHAISCGDMKELRASWKETVDGIASLWRRLFNRSGDASSESVHSAQSASDQTPPTV